VGVSPVKRLQIDLTRPNSELKVDESQHERITSTLGLWTFSAHDFTDDELLFGALLILEHALSSPELEKWQMRRGQSLPTKSVYVAC